MSAYPAVPGHRMAYDRDGSVAFWAYASVTQFTTAQAQELNSQALSNVLDVGNASGQTGAFPVYVGVIFPELRDLAGYYVNLLGNRGSTTVAFAQPAALQVSTNTTTGIDGTWINIVAPFVWDVGGPASPDYRSMIQTQAASGINAVRLDISNTTQGGEYLRLLHLYGQPSTGQNPDSLRIWQPVTNAEVTGAAFDFGDVPQGSNTVLTFRIHNNSATKIASTITVSGEALTDASPSLLGQFLFSTDGVTYTSSISIANLGPGATSPVLYVQDQVAVGAALSVWALRMVALAGTFA